MRNDSAKQYKSKMEDTFCKFSFYASKIFILIIVICYVTPSKFLSQQHLRDTSFTTNSALLKVLPNYPDVRIVQPEISKEIESRYDIVYKEIGARKLHLDLFKKREIGKAPCVLIIHGGGWASGEKKMEWPMATMLAKNGFVAATIEYRLSPEAQYPAAVEDINSAIQWIKNNSHSIGMDKRKIALLGVSAGAHLATLIALSNSKEAKSKKVLDEGKKLVQAIINMDGVVDFTDPVESGKDQDINKPSAGKKWLGYSIKENPEIWAQVSPINYLTDAAPPIIFINSSNERYHAGRERLISFYNKNKIYNEVHTISKTPHPFWLFHPWFEDVSKIVLNFLKKVF